MSDDDGDDDDANDGDAADEGDGGVTGPSSPRAASPTAPRDEWAGLWGVPPPKLAAGPGPLMSLGSNMRGPREHHGLSRTRFSGRCGPASRSVWEEGATIEVPVSPAVASGITFFLQKNLVVLVD